MTSPNHQQFTKSPKSIISKSTANAKPPIHTPPTTSSIGKIPKKLHNIFQTNPLAFQHCLTLSVPKTTNLLLFEPQEPIRIIIPRNRLKMCTRWKSLKTDSKKLEKNSKGTPVRYRTLCFKPHWLTSVAKRFYMENPSIKTTIETVTENLTQHPKNSASVFPNSKTSNNQPFSHRLIQSSQSTIKTLTKQAPTGKDSYKGHNSSR